MSEKLVEVYDRYDMEIISTKKGRGATILTTEDGLRILEPFRGNVTRLEQEYVLKQLFIEEGFENVDDLIPNKDGMLITCDRYRQPFVLKRHFDGSECDMYNPSSILQGVKVLAVFHTYGKKVAARFGEAWRQNQKDKEKRRIEEIKRALEDGEELEKISHVYEISETILEEILNMSKQNVKAEEIVNKIEKEEMWDRKKETQEQDTEKDIENVFIRHNKELKKIQKFINKVKRKNAFENLFLQVFSEYYQQGQECVRMMADIIQNENGGATKQVYQNHYGICHGAYNQHNIIMGSGYEAIVHFERFSKGNQLDDLYQFARKVMEKNHFDFDLLEQIFEMYHQIIPLSKEDYQYMYILFSYPEKFWKIANSYYNTNKAFLSPKYIEKLENVILQEREKRKMLSEYFAFHLC